MGIANESGTARFIPVFRFIERRDFLFCEYDMSTMSTEENGLSISLEHDLSTERNLDRKSVGRERVC